jgi:hypothetical protein
VPTADDLGHPELSNLGLFLMFAPPPGLLPEVEKKLVSMLQGHFIAQALLLGRRRLIFRSILEPLTKPKSSILSRRSS